MGKGGGGDISTFGSGCRDFGNDLIGVRFVMAGIHPLPALTQHPAGALRARSAVLAMLVDAVTGNGGMRE